MIEVFKKIKAECAICGTPLNGINLLKRGNRYYCLSDFDKTSPEEKAENKKQFDKIDEYKRHFR